MRAISAKFWKFVTNKTSSDQPTMSRDVNKLVLWPFPRFCFEACPWRRNGGKVDSAEKGDHCFCFGGWATKGKEIQFTDVVGLAASAWGVSRRSVKRERWLSRERVYWESEDDREEEDTAQAFCKKYNNCIIFQAIFFIHTSKNCTVLTFSKMYESQELIEYFLFYAWETRGPDFWNRP